MELRNLPRGPNGTKGVSHGGVEWLRESELVIATVVRLASPPEIMREGPCIGWGGSPRAKGGDRNYNEGEHHARNNPDPKHRRMCPTTVKFPSKVCSHGNL